MKKFLRSMLTETDGSVSYARCSGATALIAVIGWVTYLVIKTKTLPPLAEAAAFISGSYAVNKIATKVQQFVAPNGTPQTDTTSETEMSKQ